MYTEMWNYCRCNQTSGDKRLFDLAADCNYHFCDDYFLIYLSDSLLSITRTNKPLYCAISSPRLDMYATSSQQIKSDSAQPHVRIHHFARSNQIKSNHTKRVKTHSNRLSNEINTRSEAELVPNTWPTIPKVLTTRAQAGSELSPGVGLHAAFRAWERHEQN